MLEDVADSAQVLNGKIGALPTLYLGLPLGASHKDQTGWNPVLEKGLGRGSLVSRKDACPKDERKYLRAHYRAFPHILCPCCRHQASITGELEDFKEMFYRICQMEQGSFTW